ncbi:hypothetical protein [Adhaeribacter rhizoryzae]|uniref:DUF4488 domain-containing protein n=1 Tax=Adhaeribacter rhizoryzae TaxID=2607907 RepID=A0A5M6D3X1_9BACT|nr:hypothetical protein [Adhaeribacter rhizoryzae]KAA5541290.1 hypothetical protein F0145_21040 [Adhaeribacter rhizoryzae]
MKAKLLFFAMLLIGALPVFAQNPLVGTWVETSDKVEEIKIITPTHVMFLIRPLNADTVSMGGGGTYSLKGNKYIENLQTDDFTEYLINLEPYKKMKAAYDYKVENDKFYCKGTFIVSDSLKYPVNHTFVKVKSANSYPNNPGIGTWNQLSSTYWGVDSKKQSHTNATATRFQIITPTHWIRTSTRDKKVENRMAGTYTMQGNKIYPVMEYASFPINKSDKIEITQRIEGDKMYWSGIVKDATGKAVFHFEDVFQRVPGKVNKIAAAK